MSHDQQFIQLFYGNEDKSESIPLTDFKSAAKAAKFLRQVADNIEKHGNSKVYRGSEESIFQNTDISEDN